MWLFYYFNFERNYDVLKSENPCIFLNKNINFNENETESKMENTTHRLERRTLCFSSYKNRKLKVKLMRWSSRKKKEGIFCTVYFVGREVFRDLYFISMYSVLNTLIYFQNIHTFYITKSITSYTFVACL